MRSQVMDRTLDTPRVHRTELGAADQEDEAAAVAESLDHLANLTAMCPPVDAIYSPPENNQP